MRNNFQSNLILAVASLMSHVTYAELPRECFYVMDMHGHENQRQNLMTQLPTLMATFERGMRIHTISGESGIHTGERITSLDVELVHSVKYQDKYISLPTVGKSSDRRDTPTQSVKFGTQDQPDRIAILADRQGVCDVVLYQEGKQTSLSKGNNDCMAELSGINETVIRLTPEAPLIGFHGTTDSHGLNQLGLILLDATDPTCQTSHSDMFLDPYFDMNQFGGDTEIESSITREERARAQALEAILIIDNTQKARESKEEIQQQILELKKQQPLEMHHDYDIDYVPNTDYEYPEDYGEEYDEDYDSEDYGSDDFDFKDDNFQSIDNKIDDYDFADDDFSDQYASDDEEFADDVFTFDNRPGYKPDPWTEHDRPADIGEFKKLIGRLQELQSEVKYAPQISKLELSNMYNDLAKYYDFIYSDEEIWSIDTPIETQEIADVYNHLAAQDGGYSHEFDNTNPDDWANLSDIGTLLYKLGEHYQSGEGPMSEIKYSDGVHLFSIFEDMSYFYSVGDGKFLKKSHELLVLYDEFANLYDPDVPDYDDGKNDYDVYMNDDAELKKLYDQLLTGQMEEKNFEGKMIKDFHDLMNVESNQRDAKLNQLLKEMRIFENEENKGEQYLSNQYSIMESEQESQYEEIQNVEQRLGQVQNMIQGQNQDMQNMILQGQRQTEEHLDSLVAQLLAANGLQNKANNGKHSEENNNKLDLSSLGSLEKLVPGALKQLGKEERKTVDSEVDRQSERVIAQFIGIFVVVFIIGSCLGGMCILICMKCCCKINQEKRLKASNLQFEMSATNENHRAGSEPIPLQNYDTSQTNGDVDSHQKNGGKDLQFKNQETEDYTEEEKDKVAKMTESQEEEENFANIMSSRGLNFQPPQGRRQTFQRALNPPPQNNLVKRTGSQNKIDLGPMKIEDQ